MTLNSKKIEDTLLLTHCRGIHPTVQPGQSVSARFRLMFDDCGVSTTLGPTTPFAVTVCATGTSNGSPITVPSGDSVVPAEVCASAVLNCPPPPGFVTNLLTCACEKL